MTTDNAELLAAVSAGIEDANGTPTTPPVTEEPDNDTPDTTDAGDEVQGADDAGDSAGGSGGEADDGGAKPADSDGAGGDVVPADGSKPDAGKVAEGSDPEAAAKKAAEDAEAAAAAANSVKDPVNDPIPNAMKRETKERIQSLVERVKTTSSRLEEVQRDRDDILNAVISTGATPTQYTQTLEYLRQVNSGDRAQQMQALQTMQAEVAALARMVGVPVPGVNMLEGHDDLIQEVSTGRLSPDRAQEIAASRNAAKIQLHHSTVRAEQTKQSRAEQQATAEGRNALNALGTQLMARDREVYKAKAAILVESLKPVFAQIHPSQWASTFQRAYDKLPAPVRAVTPPPTPIQGVRPANGGGNQPLRAGNPAGGATPAPSSALEALNAGLAQAR